MPYRGPVSWAVRQRYLNAQRPKTPIEILSGAFIAGALICLVAFFFILIGLDGHGLAMTLGVLIAIPGTVLLTMPLWIWFVVKR